MRRLDKRKYDEEIIRIKNIIPSLQLVKVILFGSVARGDLHAGSDIDLLIVKETPLSFADRIPEVLECLNSKMPLEPLVYTPDEFEKLISSGNEFVQTVLREGVVLYE